MFHFNSSKCIRRETFLVINGAIFSGFSVTWKVITKTEEFSSHRKFLLLNKVCIEAFWWKGWNVSKDFSQKFVNYVALHRKSSRWSWSPSQNCCSSLHERRLQRNLIEANSSLLHWSEMQSRMKRGAEPSEVCKYSSCNLIKERNEENCQWEECLLYCCRWNFPLLVGD